MLSSPPRIGLLVALLVPSISAAACAHSGAGESAGSGGNGPGDLLGAGGSGLDSGRPLKCDNAGRCSCVNIASIGQPAHYGVAGLNSDNTTALTDWLNSKSSAAVDMYLMHPTLTSGFLSKYDVLIVQWLTDSNAGPYWTFTDDEVAALKTWVNNGGGFITLSGYDSNAQEVMPLNRLLSFSDISYNMDDVLSVCPTSAANLCYCWGNSVPLGAWAAGPIGKNVTQVGAFHGRSINPGSATVDCSDTSHVYAAHETIGKGRVVAYTDEWVTYSSQWLGASPTNNTAMYTDPNNPCYDKSAANVFQVPQFWYNVIGWAASTKCMFTIEDPGVIQ